MGGMSIQANGTILASGASSDAGATNAERAYQAALKALRQAQQHMAKDAGDHADEKTVEADKMAVEQAATAVASAASAVAAEKAAAQQHRQQNKAGDGPVGTRSSSSVVETLASLVAADSMIDTYS